MRKCTLTKSNCESKDHRASAGRVHLSRFPESPYGRAVKPRIMPLAGGFWRAAFVAKVSLTELPACSLLSRFSFAVNAPLPLRSLSSQFLHLVEVISSVVLAK